MVPCYIAGLLSLLTLSAAHPSQQPPAASQQPPAASQQTSAAPQQPSAADQLSVLLTPVVERAVSRAQSGCQLVQLERLQDGADAGQKALTELTRQQVRLDTVVHDLAVLQLAVLTGGGRSTSTVPGDICPPSQVGQGPESKQKQELEQQPQQRQTPTCETQPAPLPADVATYKKPAVHACARSCQQLRNQNETSQDGVYWLTGLPVPVFCDFSHDGGGWTLLLTAISKLGWDPLSVLGRSELSPSLTDNYSILQYANTIRDLGTSDRFAYRIETQAEKGRQRWGGIWFAPRRYSFTDETGTQTEVSLMRRFDNWNYKDVNGVKRRMPWINTGGNHRMYPVLTTASQADWWGTLVTHQSYAPHNHSPWLKPEGTHSGTVLYWMREDAL